MTITSSLRFLYIFGGSGLLWAVGEVQMGTFKNLQTGSWPPGCVLTNFRFLTKIRAFSSLCILGTALFHLIF